MSVLGIGPVLLEIQYNIFPTMATLSIKRVGNDIGPILKASWSKKQEKNVYLAPAATHCHHFPCLKFS